MLVPVKLEASLGYCLNKQITTSALWLSPYTLGDPPFVCVEFPTLEMSYKQDHTRGLWGPTSIT